MRLRQLGWTGFLEAEWNSRERNEGRPARVMAEYRGIRQFAGESSERRAVAAGKLRIGAAGGRAWPVVGDWVSVWGSPRSKDGLQTCGEGQGGGSCNKCW
jgi:hypothetical protein